MTPALVPGELKARRCQAATLTSLVTSRGEHSAAPRTILRHFAPRRHPAAEVTALHVTMRLCEHRGLRRPHGQANRFRTG
jgi:hypothetical protein